MFSVSKRKNHISYGKYIEFQKKLRKKRREMILFVEHSPTITCGINAKEQNLLVAKSELRKRNIELYEISRGGDFTAHEIGQFIAYVHIDLKKRNLKIADFLNKLALVFIKTTKQLYHLDLVWDKEFPGLYVKENGKKIISFGVYFKSFFTSYGVAFNVLNDLKTFDFINPCGLEKKKMTSLALLGIKVDELLLKKTIQENFIEIFKLSNES